MKKFVGLLLVGVALCATLVQAAPKKRAVAATSKQAKAHSEPQVVVATEETDYSASSSRADRFEIEPMTGVAFMSPGDINSSIRDANDQIQKKGVKSFNAGDIGSAVSYGLAMTYRILPNFGLGLGFNRLGGVSEASAKVGENTLTGKASMGANLFTIEARFIPLTSPNGKLELLISPQAGLGLYSYSTEIGGTAAVKALEANASAMGPVFGSTIGGRYWIAQYLSLGLNAGYRYAKSGTLKVDSQKGDEVAVGSALDNNGKSLQADASSFVIGTQLTLSL